jgi:hypothetical protein
VTGPNRGGRLSDSYLVHVMGDVEQFYAFMADPIMKPPAGSTITAGATSVTSTPGCGGSGRNR